MKLHWSPRSPFVRKVVVLLHETGQYEQVERIRSVVAMADPNAALMADNPLSQIPTLLLDDGSALYDSPVICEYLDSRHDRTPLFPPAGPARWLALRRQALADGMLAILLLWRQERMKDAARATPAWLDAFELKISTALNQLEGEAADLAGAGDIDIGHISLACMLSYLDYRFAGTDWRAARPQLAAWHQDFSRRPSMAASMPDDAAT